MNLTAALTASLLAVVPSATALAAVVDPVDYAVKYCELRAAGVKRNDAVQRAVMTNIDYSREATVLPDGVDLDVRLGYYGVKELCPEFAFDE